MKKTSNELLVGAHVSASDGVYNAWQNAAEIDANCMQIFTANQMQWHPKKISDEDATKFRELRSNSEVKQMINQVSKHKQPCKSHGA
jgi:endonuclease IV